MEKTVFILCADKEEALALRDLLHGQNASSLSFSRMEEMEEEIRSSSCLAVLVDLDSVPVKSREVRKLVSLRPGVKVLCLSRSRYHPELAEAISTDVYACVSKPVDPEELHFWLRSAGEERPEVT